MLELLGKKKGGKKKEKKKRKERENMKHQMANSGNRRCHGKEVAIIYS